MASTTRIAVPPGQATSADRTIGVLISSIVRRERPVAAVDQLLVFTAGEGEAILDGERSRVSAGRLVHVPAGTRHNIINMGTDDLRLYTIYAPPEHAPGTIHHTRADAEAAEAPSHA